MSESYLLFAGDIYYPMGGMEDFKGEFGSVGDAREFAESGDTYGFQWVQIVKRESLVTVLDGYRDSLEADLEWEENG